MAVLSALCIGVVNSIIGYWVAKVASTKDLNVFMALVFGSLAIRGLVVVALAYVALGVLGMHQVAFALTFSISSFASLMVEVFYFHHTMEKQKKLTRSEASGPFQKK